MNDNSLLTSVLSIRSFFWSTDTQSFLSSPLPERMLLCPLGNPDGHSNGNKLVKLQLSSPMLEEFSMLFNHLFKLNLSNSELY